MMVSVTERAIEIYMEARERAKRIAEKDGITCRVDIPFKFKEKGIEWEIKLYENELYIETNSKKIIKRKNWELVFEKDNLLARYLLENAGWEKRTKIVEFILPPSRTLDLDSLRVEKIHYQGSLSNLLELEYKSLRFKIPIERAEILDTVFFMYTGKEPKLENFLAREMIRGETAQANIKRIPPLPPRFAPEIKLKEGFNFPIERIVKRVEGYRKRAIER